MDLSMENEARSSDAEQDGTSSSRRKSGRAVRKPQLFSQDIHSRAANTAEKRKRTSINDDADEDDNVEDASESEDDQEDEEPDEEEEKELRRLARKATKRSTATKSSSKSKSSRAAKKPKINGTGKSLPIRGTANGKKNKTPKKAKARTGPPRPVFRAVADGLYADIFEDGRDVDTVVEEWLSGYEKDPTEGLRVLFNFSLQCTGADFSLDTQDVTDEDQWPQRLEDLQGTHMDEKPVDYPLTSKEKKFRSFRSTLLEFCDTWVESLHRSSLLYNSAAPAAKFQIWLGQMASGGNRAFRHTAVVLSIGVANALCDIAEGITSTVSTSRKQFESEKKKKTANKGRMSAIQSTIQENEERLEAVNTILSDIFDSMWIHRYRDIDPKIRTECFLSLTEWMQTYRDMFLESQYVRYLGWGLSDKATQVRSTVVGQLRHIYELKFSVAALRSFTGRFLRRLVEMATRDADVGVRASTIELVGLIRDMGLMENEDIDAIGQLVFDIEPRIRKAAGRFFATNLQEIFDTSTEEMAEDINEVFADEDEEDFESPKRSWIKFKCLVDILQTYDGQKDESRPDRQLGPIEVLSGASVESRFFLATEAIYPHMEELEQWQSLAGYLLYDHSQITDSPPQDAVSNVRKFYALEEGQDIILLEVLVCAVKLRILEIAKSDINRRGQKIKSLTDKIPEMQEETAHSLTQIIPRLLNSFGAVPEAASAVLRLEHLVDLNMIQDLQKDATAYSSLLNDINKQFLTHSDQDVLAEASVAFLHARSSEEMKEAMESKAQELWDDMIDALGTLSQNKELQGNSSVRSNILADLANTVTRISNLASITDCTSILETVPSSTGKKRKQNLEAPFNTLIHLAKRGLRDEESDEDLANLETELVVNSIKSLLFYFMWKVQALSTAVKSGHAPFNTAYFETFAKSRDLFVATLTAIMQKRTILDDVRFAALTNLLDVQTLFGTLRHIGSNIKVVSESADEDVVLQTQALAQNIIPSTQATISRFHDTAERALAKRLKKHLGSEVEEAPLESAQDLKDLPSDEEEEEQDEGEDELADESKTNERLRTNILAEQRLCEITGKIVLAIIGRVLDTTGPERGKLKQKLLRNKTRLGHNYKEVVAFLEDRKARSASRPAAAKDKQSPETGANQAAATAKSSERVDEEEEEDDPIVDEDDEDDLRARGLVDDIIDDDAGESASDQEDVGGNGNEDEDEIMGD
jgi:cohesin complex subunit SA-1/2